MTQPSSPNQNGKVERFHGTFRPEIAEAGPFESLAAAQAAVDAWVEGYNRDRPHQGLDERVPVVPADRFAPAEPGGLELWLPPALGVSGPSGPDLDQVGEQNRTCWSPAADRAPAVDRELGSAAAIELDRVVPPSGNMALCGNQFWLGPARAGQMVRFWIDCDWVHLSVGGHRVKSLRSRFTVKDLDALVGQGAIPAGPPPLPSRKGPGSTIGRSNGFDQTLRGELLDDAGPY